MTNGTYTNINWLNINELFNVDYIYFVYYLLSSTVVYIRDEYLAYFNEHVDIFIPSPSLDILLYFY